MKYLTAKDFEDIINSLERDINFLLEKKDVIGAHRLRGVRLRAQSEIFKQKEQ